MSKDWPSVKLGEILESVRKPVDVKSDATYREIGIRSHGKGVFHKEAVSGLELGNKRVFWVEPGTFVLNIVFAWEGAVAVLGDAEAGMIGSHRFPMFRPDEARLDSRFLLAYFKTPEGLELLGRVSPGGAGRNRTLSQTSFLQQFVPLPPLPEQRRVVARIEQLGARIHQALSLRHQAVDEADALHLSVLHQHFVSGASSWMMMPMEEAVEISDKQVDPTLPEYSQLPHISGENMESQTCHLLPWRTAEADGVRSKNYLFAPGTVLYSKIRPYLRKAVFVDFHGICSADVYPIRVKSPKLDPHFVKWALVAEPFTEYANRLSGRTRMPKLNRKQLFGFALSHPTLTEQHRIVAELDGLQAEVDALKRLQTETAAELDALLPSVLSKVFAGEM
ncbi:MAG: restriction endonuclease subunit S [Bryobacteraceae bacterium]|jgi:type I restriction enzyme S subunit